MLQYAINNVMEFITLDDSEQVIHDTESGDIHYINAISKVILEQLSNSMTFDELIVKLLEMFDGDPAKIRSDTHKFVDKLVEKRILLEVNCEDEDCFCLLRTNQYM